MSTAFTGSGGNAMTAIQKNLKDNGGQAIATIVLAPVAAKLVKRLARKPISDMNRLGRMSGITTSLGVKI